MVSRQKTWTPELKSWGVSANANIMAIGLGGLQAVALSFPINGLISAALQVLALSGLVVLIRHSKQVLRASWLFSITWLAGSVAWLYTALHVFGQMPAWLSVLAIGVLCGGLAMYYSCALWAFASIEKKIHKALAVLLFASAWTSHWLCPNQQSFVVGSTTCGCVWRRFFVCLLSGWTCMGLAKQANLEVVGRDGLAAGVVAGHPSKSR